MVIYNSQINIYVADYAALGPLQQSIFVHEMILVYQLKVLGVDPKRIWLARAFSDLKERKGFPNRL